LALDGNLDTELQYLKSVAWEWQQKMIKAKLMHADVTSSLWSAIFWKIVYPLAVTMFLEQECYDIMQPILQAGLPKVGIVISPWP